MRKSFVYPLGLILLAACGTNDQQQTQTPAPEEPKKPACTYSYDGSATEVLWVAYKFTEKKGVKGVFDSVSVSNVQEASDPAGVISGASFEIQTASTNSGDPTRDPKIVGLFFGKMTGGDKITGKVVSVEGNEKEGKISFSLSMNGVEKPLEGTYTVAGDKLEAKAELNVSDWAADAALASLNEGCKELHTGTDGTSRLWPDVSVFITTTLKKTCP